MSVIKKTIIGVLLGAAACTAMYYGALFVLPKVVNLNEYKEDFSRQLETQTGFKFLCDNIQFKQSFSPYLKIYMYHTLVLYPDNSEFLKLKEAELNIKILPLIFKKIVIKDAKLTRPIIKITLYKDFSTSLEKYIDTDKIFKANGFKMNAVIADTLCSRYKVKIFDESLNKEFYLEGDELLLKNLKLNDSAHIILKGSIFQDKKEYLKYNLDLTSYLTKEKIKFTFSPFKSIYESDVTGNVEGNIKINEKNNVKGTVKIIDLSLKADDIYLKDNFISLIFKGEEAEFNSSLHTSLKDKVEAKGKFSYGKKRYIDLHTTALNINLSNLSKIVSEVSKILNLKNPLTDISVKGILNADFSVNSDFKKLKSKGSAAIKNATISTPQIPYKLTDLNADINFNDNKIQIDRAGLKINSTPIKLSGQINQDVSVNLKAEAENLDLKALISVFLNGQNIPINILKGRLSFISEIKGNINKALTSHSVVNTSNITFVEKNFGIPVSIEKAKIILDTDKTKYKGEVNSDFNAKYDKAQISSKNFGFIFDDKEIKIQNKDILINNSPVNISGIIKNYRLNPDVNINYSANLNSKDIGTILSKYIKNPYKAVGIIKASGVYSYKDKISKIKSQLNADKDNYISYLVIKELLNKPSITNIEAEIKNKEVTVKEISISENKQKAQKIINITGQIINEKNPVFKNLRIQIPYALTAAMNFFGGEEISLNSDIIINNTLDKPKISGSAKIQKYNLKKFLTSIKNADIIFAENNIKITAPEVYVKDSLFNISADVAQNLDFNNLLITDMQVNSLNLDLNSLFELQGKINNSNITIKKGSATVNNLKILDLTAKDIVSDFEYSKNIINLSNITANAYTGQVKGNINYDLNHGLLKIDMKGKDIDVKTSLYDLCKIEDNLGGKADFTANISLLTGPYKEVIKSINGKLDYIAQNGKMGTLGKFEYYLYAQNLLYHGLLNATLNRLVNTLKRDNTSCFKESKGEITFNNGYLLTENLTTTGVNMSLFMQGRHNMLTNQANIDIYGRISDEIKNKLGTFGNVSISDMMNSKQDKKVTVMKVPNEITDKIPQLYKHTNDVTNTFKVNITGDINSLGAINSFVWILPKEEIIQQVQTEEALPSFSEL